MVSVALKPRIRPRGHRPASGYPPRVVALVPLVPQGNEFSTPPCGVGLRGQFRIEPAAQPSSLAHPSSVTPSFRELRRAFRLSASEPAEIRIRSLSEQVGRLVPQAIALSTLVHGCGTAQMMSRGNVRVTGKTGPITSHARVAPGFGGVSLDEVCLCEDDRLSRQLLAVHADTIARWGTQRNACFKERPSCVTGREKCC